MTAPISTSPVLPVQTAVYQRLTGDATLMGMLAGDGVYDEPPEPAAYPYVRIGDVLSIPDNVHGAYGREVTFTIHVWTRARGITPGQQIATRVGELLDHQEGELAVAGHEVVSIRQEFDQQLRDPDREIRHAILRYRIVTEQE